MMSVGAEEGFEQTQVRYLVLEIECCFAEELRRQGGMYAHRSMKRRTRSFSSKGVYNARVSQL